jgi:hypothetical protein
MPDIICFVDDTTGLGGELGLILHSTQTWVMAYVPGPDLADPADPAAIRVIGLGKAARFEWLHELRTSVDEAWVIRVWEHLEQHGPGSLGSAPVVRKLQMAAEIASLRKELAEYQGLGPTPEQGVEVTREQLAEWTGLGLALTDDHVTRLQEAMPHSSIPEAFGTMAEQFEDDEDPDDEDGSP